MGEIYIPQDMVEQSWLEEFGSGDWGDLPEGMVQEQSWLDESESEDGEDLQLAGTVCSVVAEMLRPGDEKVNEGQYSTCNTKCHGYNMFNTQDASSVYSG